MQENLWREIRILVAIAVASLLLAEFTGHLFLIAALGFGLYIASHLRSPMTAKRPSKERYPAVLEAAWHDPENCGSSGFLVGKNNGHMYGTGHRGAKNLPKNRGFRELHLDKDQVRRSGSRWQS